MTPPPTQTPPVAASPDAASAAAAGLVICVLVPTFRRVGPLAACLEALAAQSRPPDEVLVTVRDADNETREFFGGGSLPRRLPVRVVTVTEGGVVAAMNAGLAAARPDADVIALVDDDAVPRPDWMERIARTLGENPGAAGVGGRDILPWDADEPDRAEVGMLRWWGKAVGFHHKGVGPAREVDVLKGANCAFRAAPLRRLGFDRGLRGAGAQVHWEMSLCLALRREGAGALIYDPALLVDHNPAPRHDSDVNHRGGFDAPSLGDAIYNETLVLLRELPPARRAAFWAWTHLVGTRISPGLVQLARLLLLRRDRDAWAKLRVAFAARADARRDLRRAGQRAAGLTGEGWTRET